MSRYTVCVDFDGVLHSYTSPWVNAHTIPDPPVAGAMRWLRVMLEKFDVVILSTRCKTWRGRRAMRRWLTMQESCECSEPFGVCIMHNVKFAKTKPAALIYLDDRAVRFTGPDSWPTVDAIHKARPWNKQIASTASGGGNPFKFDPVLTEILTKLKVAVANNAPEAERAELVREAIKRMGSPLPADAGQQD